MVATTLMIFEWIIKSVNKVSFGQSTIIKSPLTHCSPSYSHLICIHVVRDTSASVYAQMF